MLAVANQWAALYEAGEAVTARYVTYCGVLPNWAVFTRAHVLTHK